MEVDQDALQEARREAETRMQAKVDKAAEAQKKAEEQRKKAEEELAAVRQQLEAARQAERQAVISGDKDLALFELLFSQGNEAVNKLHGAAAQGPRTGRYRTCRKAPEGPAGSGGCDEEVRGGMTDRAIELLEEQQRKVKERSAPWDGGGAAERYLPPGAAQRGNPGAGPGKRLHVHYGGGEENQGFCRWAQERRLSCVTPGGG